jgi:hypothetical protein
MRVPDINWLLEAKEGENVEFKKAENTFEFDELAKYACALSNRGGGGRTMSGLALCFFCCIFVQVSCKLLQGNPLCNILNMLS